MSTGQESKVLELKALRVEDPFWSPEMDLVRRTVLPSISALACCKSS